MTIGTGSGRCRSSASNWSSASLPEAIWAVAGALALVVFGLLPWTDALIGVRKGIDVYLFLTGMMLIAELARREGLFDWFAALAVKHARVAGIEPFLFMPYVRTKSRTSIVREPRQHLRIFRLPVTSRALSNALLSVRNGNLGNRSHSRPTAGSVALMQHYAEVLKAEYAAITLARPSHRPRNWPTC